MPGRDGDESAVPPTCRLSVSWTWTARRRTRVRRRVNALLFELADLLQDVPPGDGAFDTTTLPLARDDARRSRPGVTSSMLDMSRPFV